MRRRRAAAAIANSNNNNNNNDPSIGSVPARFHGGGGPKFPASSAPATPLGGSVSSIPMELGLEYIDKEHDNEYYLDCGSIASCEEASEATTSAHPSAHPKYLLSPDGVTSAVSPLQRAFKKRGSKSGSAASSPPDAGGRTTPSSGSNTAGILPKFLRSSFRGLFKGAKPDLPSAEVPEPEGEGEGGASPPSSALAALAMKKSTTFQSLVNSAQQNESERAKAATGSNTCQVCQCHSPTTEAYLEENRLNGLPVIPFAFPTSVVAERMRQRRKKPSGGDSDKSPTENMKSLPQDIVRRNVSLASMDHLYPGEFDFGGPKSLENLVYIAQRELISESLQRGEDIDIPFMLRAAGTGASASSMDTGGTAYSAASDDIVDEEIASLSSVQRNREDSDVGITMVAAPEDANKTPVVRPPPLTSRKDSGGYFEMAPLTSTAAATTTSRRGNSFSPPKGGFSRKSSGPSPSSPPRITAQRPGDTVLSPAASRPQRSQRPSVSDDFFEMDFSGGGGTRT